MNHGPVQGFCVKMDGREFVNMPPLGLSGLPLEPGRVSSGAAGGGRLIPSTGQLPPFCTAKYFPTPLGLHSQPVHMLKIRWKTMRDNYRREYLKQQKTRSGSGGKSSRVYCHYTELQFLKPVMQLRQTESNMSSDTEEDADQTQLEDNQIDETQLLFEDEDIVNTQEPVETTDKQVSRSRPKKLKNQTQEFIDVVKTLMNAQRDESGEISLFLRSLIPQMKKIDPALQCDMRVDMIRLIQSYQQRSASASQCSQSFGITTMLIRIINQVAAGTSYDIRNMSYPPIAQGQVPMPQYHNARFHGGPFDPPVYRPPFQHPLPPPREDPHPLPPSYQDL